MYVLKKINIIKETKKCLGPAVGFFCQFLMMPLLSFLVGYLITDDKLFRYVGDLGA